MALSAPRETALKVLHDVDANGAYLNLSLEKALAEAKMDQRDSALCTGIVMGVVKNRLYIDHIIGCLSSVKLKKLSVWILNILRMGVYCLKFTDKIPPSATVNECVKLSRRYGHDRAAGYVNAVLRKAAESGDFLENLRGDELLSVKYSMPLWLVEKWKREQPNHEKLIAAMNEEPQTCCRLNCGELPPEFVRNEITPYAAIYTGKGGVTHSEAYKQGLVTVQDPASQLAVLALDIKPGMRVLDLCAAPGGKSVFAAYLGGEVTACDLYEHKITLINSAAERLGVKLTALVNDACVYNPDFEGSFDRVLADVPCSGLGILRRKPDIKWAKTEGDSGDLAEIQQTILDNAAKYLVTDGRLVYSTCTISRAENEGISKWFLKKHPDFVPAPLNVGPEPGTARIQLRPDIHGTDGFFMAAFVKERG